MVSAGAPPLRLKGADSSHNQAARGLCCSSVLAGVSKFSPLRFLAGDFIGIFAGEVRCSSASTDEAVISLVDTMAEASDEIITLFYGASVEKDEAEALQAAVQLLHQDKAVELHEGGQPYAHYLISVE